MEILALQLPLAVFAIVIAMGFASAVQGATAPPVVVVGLAKCSDCTRKNMNAEAAFRGLQVAVKCKNSEGEYESTAVGQVDKSGAFSVPLAADLVGDNGELKRDCFAQLHSASSAPCPGQEPSRIVAAAPPRHGGDEKATFVALGGKVHRSSPECASAFLCYPFLHKYHHIVGVHEPDHGHSVSVPPVTLPPVTLPPVDVSVLPLPVPEQKPPSTPVYTPPSTPEYTPPKPTTPIYNPPAQRDAVTEP